MDLSTRLKKYLSPSLSPEYTNRLDFILLNQIQRQEIDVLLLPGKSQGSKSQRLISGMTAAGNGQEKAFLLRYCTTSSSSVGWNLKPGGSLTIPFLMKLIGLSVTISSSISQASQAVLCLAINGGEYWSSGLHESGGKGTVLYSKRMAEGE